MFFFNIFFSKSTTLRTQKRICDCFRAVMSWSYGSSRFRTMAYIHKRDEQCINLKVPLLPNVTKVLPWSYVWSFCEWLNFFSLKLLLLDPRWWGGWTYFPRIINFVTFILFFLTYQLFTFIFYSTWVQSNNIFGSTLTVMFT